MHQEELPANGTCLWPVCPNTSSNSLEQVHHQMTCHVLLPCTVHTAAFQVVWFGGHLTALPIWPSHQGLIHKNISLNMKHVYVLFACFTCLLGRPPAQLACSLFSVHHTKWFILPPPHTAAWCVFTISVANAALSNIVFSPPGRMRGSVLWMFSSNNNLKFWCWDLISIYFKV